MPGPAPPDGRFRATGKPSFPLLTGPAIMWCIRRHGRVCSSAGEHYVDIVGVTGSIPVTPTIQGPDFLVISDRLTYFPTGSVKPREAIVRLPEAGRRISDENPCHALAEGASVVAGFANQAVEVGVAHAGAVQLLHHFCDGGSLTPKKPNRLNQTGLPKNISLS